MTTIAADQAKNEFEALLNRAAAGEEILITENGQPVVKMVPAKSAREPNASGEGRRAMTLEELREFRRNITLGPDLTLRELIEEGRRH